MPRSRSEFNMAKADFDSAYRAPTPVAYVERMQAVGYEIPQNALPVFEQVIAHLQRRRGRPLRILDVGASYGINAALLRYRMDLSSLYGHYRSKAQFREAPSDLLQEDRAFFSTREPRFEGTFIGVDASASAIAYATANGLLDEGLAIDLEDEAAAQAAIDPLDVDLVISTGTIGYIGPVALDRVLDFCREPHKVWLAAFCVHLIDFAPYATRLAARGMVHETHPAFFRQRSLAGRDEQDRLVAYGRDHGVRVDGLEASGGLFASFHLARPQKEAEPQLLALLRSEPAAAAATAGVVVTPPRGAQAARPTAALASGAQEAGTVFAMTRDEIIGEPSYTKSSNLGVVQFRHDYDPAILATIACKALALRHAKAERRHLNLTYIRGAHLHIPEILELVHAPGRLERLSRIAGVELEVYPLSIISSIITFQDADSAGSIVWHTDGIPITEMVPLAIDELVGGELELYRGSSEVGLARHYEAGEEITEGEIVRLAHRLGYSILGQLMRLMHRVHPISSGLRVTLNMNLRSARHPYIDDNSVCYLAADNPDLAWQEEYIADVRGRQLPAYLKSQSGSLAGDTA